MRKLLILTLFCSLISDQALCNGITLSGNHVSTGKTPFVFNVDEANPVENEFARHKRNLDGQPESDLYKMKIKHLDDKHKQLMVHWVGEGSSVIVCLARDPASLSDITSVNPSALYISYDYGDTYENKTDDFKLADGNYSTLEKSYTHPKFNTHLVFTDIIHKTIFVTTDHGRTIRRIEVGFSPTDIIFYDSNANTFFAHDKNHPEQKLYLTKDFGNSFVLYSDFVKSIHWMKDSKGDQELIQYRMEPKGVGTILYSNAMFQNPVSTVYAMLVKDLFISSDYIFTTTEGEHGNVDLYVSYKFGPRLKCLFDTQLDRKSYFLVDVTENRALVAVSHDKTVSHLYVSDNLGGINGNVEFTLSLENVLCYFPNYTWHDTLMELIAEDTFADVYKVQGLSGIYIASRIVQKPTGNTLGPQNLGSVITFDHGATWRLIEAPLRDIEGQSISCDIQKGCSLHLSQKFSYLYPNTKTTSILSSKSAPGILVATGIIGTNLKGHYGVYVSSDAGRTWRQTLRDLHFFNMGDHGGILTATQCFRSRGETKYVFYSTDVGETWKQVAFSNESLRIYGLMTEPGENTTVFTMFGSLPSVVHKWIIIKLDLLKAFQYNCTKDDYKTWSPSQTEGGRSYVPCVMGQQKTYKRRMPHSNCYNGLNFDAPISVEPCNCDILDYECDFGFVRTGKSGHCIRNKTVLIDPYKVPEHCPQGKFYNRTKGYRKISSDQCVEGFEKHYLPDQVPCPFNEVQDFLLFAQRQRISRFNLVTKTLEELPVKNLKNLIAIDFDMKNNCVYWADIALDVIGRQCLNHGSVREILVSSDLASIEGMAFDWISNTLYFVDGMRSKIELIRTDIHHSGRMRKTILGPNVLKKPRGIALHPKHGYMFWTDWSVENPSVNRADLDGSNIKLLFKKPIVEWPNGITIDYIAERVYWVDARQDYIASSDLHGDDMKYIIKDNEVVSHPFAVTVFKSSVFWDDWKRLSIFSADKDSSVGNLQSLEVLQKQLVGLMDLKVFAHGMQIGNNTCTPKSCSYLCVGSPSKRGHTCLCPDGMIRQNNNCLCPGNAQPSKNGTCPQQNGTCDPEHFTCEDHTCVPTGWRCDGEPDCADGSDELNCKTESCPPSYFVCGDGKCIPQSWRCDFTQECADGSDELNCPKANCTKDRFSCSNGHCISMKWRCDGENDCKDNSDELNCSASEPITCRSDEFHCGSGGTTCIPNTWRCDREPDCKDGSDEVNCDNILCTDGRFSCGPPSYACILSSWVCDGEADCMNGTDEKNCSHVVLPPPRPKLPDLFNAQNGSCIEWMFKCHNQKCIPFSWKCDHADDCGDGSDELGCPPQQEPIPVFPTTTAFSSTIAPKLCGQYQFQCSSGHCILNSWLCDGITDCNDGADEMNCNNSSCDSRYFRCRKDGSCIFRNLVCDNRIDCPDGTDELNCDLHLPKVPEAPSCTIGLFPCDGRLCLPLTLLCNGHVDCPDGFDERNCTNTTRVYQVLRMGADESRINETNILFYWWIPVSSNVKLEFMASINRIGENKWQNKTWTTDSQYEFTNLNPFSTYNMTVYVRNNKTGVVFPPAQFITISTREGKPSPPWNVTAKQLQEKGILITWNKPAIPNGIITAYEISWRSTEPNLRSLKLNRRNETFYILSADFVHNTTYLFYVTAYNRRYKSDQSETVTLVFDKDTELNKVEDLAVVKVTNSSISLAWNYTGLEPEGFHIDISITNQAYPKLDPKTTRERKIIIDNLSPGVMHQFKIHAYKKHFSGPAQIISQATQGKPLPEIHNIKGTINSSDPTSAKLTWERPHDDRNANWIYGVYYGIEASDFFNRAKLETQNLSASVSNLGACEIYTFTVGIVGPVGYGPLSRSWVELTTYPDPRAPPKHLTVSEDSNNPLKMKLQWEPSCKSEENISYTLRVYESTKKDYSLVKLKNMTGPYIHHIFDVSYGGVYNVSVATSAHNAQYTPGVLYYAPPLLPPYEVKVENNGSYILTWQEREIPQAVGPYKYEVLVSPGNTLDESKAEKYLVDKPPFIYTNFTSNMYTFSVKLKTHNNFSSILSEQVPMSNEFKTSVTLTKSSVSTAVICVLTLFILLSAVIGILFVRHRRLQKSFTRFANSHYDTRSGAATFDDSHGLEDEIPRIQGFSDDEPLVIA